MKIQGFLDDKPVSCPVRVNTSLVIIDEEKKSTLKNVQKVVDIESENDINQATNLILI